MDKKYKKITLIAFVLVMLITAGAFVFSDNSQKPTQIPPTQSDTPTIIINGHKFSIEIADTSEKRTLGLSHRQSIPADEGILFVFESPGWYQFWMGGMLFPLDFVWINGDNVVDITQNVPAPVNDASARIINPKLEVDKVLEINSGQIKSAGIKIGQKVQIIES